MEEGQIDRIRLALNMEKEGNELQKEGSLPEAKKGKETDSPLEPEKNTTLPTPWF